VNCYLINVDCIVNKVITLVLLLDKKLWVAIGAFTKLKDPLG
jgi:hypothetical protein